MQKLLSTLRKAKPRHLFFAFCVLAIATRFIPIPFVASPECHIRVVDDAGQPLPGLKVNQHWTTSEKAKGYVTSSTDQKGVATFPREIRTVNLFRLMTRPLLAFVPVMCGFNSELYSISTFEVYWPAGYVVNYEGREGWSKEGTGYKRADGVFVQDSEDMRDLGIKDHVEFGLTTRSREFDFTLTLQRIDTQRAKAKASEEPEFKISPRANE